MVNSPYTRSDAWLTWIVFFSSTLIFSTLFLVAAIWWHLLISTLTLIILCMTSSKPIKSLGFILVLVAFLGCLQIIFSPMMRELFLRSLAEGFHWADWQYLLIAVERFAWPLVIVSTFQDRLSNPGTLTQLTQLLSPLRWVGLQVGKLQTLVILALRFVPVLKVEFERFSRFQTYFVAGTPRRNLNQRLKYWQGVLKAMIAHTIQRSMGLGELLAMRGLPVTNDRVTNHHPMRLTSFWFTLGIILYLLNFKVFILWIGMSIWMILTHFSRSLQVSS